MPEDIPHHRQRSPVNISPDPRSAEFAIEAHRQSLLIALSPFEREDQDFIDSITVDLWEDDDWNAQIQQ